MRTKAFTHHQHNTGFTLIELMVTLVVLGIVMSVAIPSFTGMLTQNSVVEASNRLVSAVQFVRSESIKRNSPTALGSNTSRKWHEGWKVYAGNLTGSDVAGAEDTLIRVYDSSLDSVTINGNSHAGTWLSFFANGMLNEDADGIFHICNGDDASTGRIVTVDRGGRTRVDNIPGGGSCTP